MSDFANEINSKAFTVIYEYQSLSYVITINEKFYEGFKKYLSYG